MTLTKRMLSHRLLVASVLFLPVAAGIASTLRVKDSSTSRVPVPPAAVTDNRTPVKSMISNPRMRHTAPSTYDLSVGQAAPDFTLSDITGTHTVRLSAKRGTPVVLLFGSHTCPFFCKSTSAIQQLYKKYGNRAAFYIIYGMEEHPTIDGERPSGWTNGVYVERHRTMEERRIAAKNFAAAFRIPAPVLVDTMDNRATTDYDCLPDRAYVVDADGKLAYVGGLGPWDYHVEEVGPVLERLLTRKPIASLPEATKRQ